MEDAKDQPSISVSGNKGGGSAKLLRYPLRSATKSKDDKPPVSTPATASASRRGRPSSVSQSVGVLDLSTKEKSAKPPRRLSISTKSAASPAPKLAGNITPISEARANRSGNIQGKNDTPVSDVSRSSSRRKFSVLSSASYWLSQIKLSEVAAKHQVSIGFFKLAQEAACENLQLLRDELKSYALRYSLLDLGEPAKEVFRIYNILENIEQLQVSETCCSHEPEEGTRSLPDDAQSLSSIAGSHKLKPRSLNSTTSSAAKETTMKNPVTKTGASANKKMGSKSTVSVVKCKKNLQKPSKKESNKEKQIVTKPASEEGVVSSPEEMITEENKENMDAPSMEEINLEA